jgi:Transcription-repair coupling factor (superfamily II helicase)
MKIELPVDAHLPADYVESERLRLEMYKRLAAVATDADIEAVREELLDRYGPLPQPVAALLAVAAFRLQAKRCGVQEVVGQGNFIRFAPADLPERRSCGWPASIRDLRCARRPVSSWCLGR